MLSLQYEDLYLVLAPACGGSIVSADKAGQPLLRPASDEAVASNDVLGMACFPLVPYSNRIAQGRFVFEGRAVTLPPNMGDHPHSIHGTGWRGEWVVDNADETHATLSFEETAGGWPWAFRAWQTFSLDAEGFSVTLGVRNNASDRMPVGLGLHPYFPRDQQTRLHALFGGEWQHENDLPVRWDRRAEPVDWWQGRPVSSRLVDTAYTGRRGDLSIEWPGHRFRLDIRPDDLFAHTVVYVPPGEDYFCVEPVSHMPNAINRPEPASVTGLRVMEPGETLQGVIRFIVAEDSV
jgi:aldose 1-epimerase